MNRPFSRSAAKRQSVMTLGSIEHLQHYFTRTGIAAQPSPRLLAVPALGAPHTATTSAPHTDPPPPPPPPPPVRTPAFPSFQTDPDALLPGVVADLAAVARVWDAPAPVDVLDLLKTTTRAVRAVRNYLIALPGDDPGALRAQYRNKVAAAPVPKRAAPQSRSHLARIRTAALDVLAALRDLEERSRLPLSDDVYDAQSDPRGASPAVLDDDDDAPHIDPDLSVSFVRVQGRNDSVPVWEDETDALSDDDREKRDHWDDRLVLGGGWLYRQDIRLPDLAREHDAVRRYIDLVDDVLFGGSRDGVRGWQREAERCARRAREPNRRVSTGDVFAYRFPPGPQRAVRRVVSSAGILDAFHHMSLSEEPEDVEEDDLPDWAKRSLFLDNPIGRAHALLAALLPQDLCPDPSALWSALTSGQCLCIAYNTAVRRSRKPWGFISVDSIHDIAALEQSADGDEKAKIGWTFRRIDNLRLWAGALKLRYLIPLVMPSTPSRPDHISRTASPARGASPGPSPLPDAPSPSRLKVRSATDEPALTFDPRLVARKDDGWETMLETVVLRWVRAVVEEARGA